MAQSWLITTCVMCWIELDGGVNRWYLSQYRSESNGSKTGGKRVIAAIYAIIGDRAQFWFITTKLMNAHTHLEAVLVPSVNTIPFVS